LLEKLRLTIFSGQFVDGHKQEDVGEYRNTVFLLAMMTHKVNQQNYNKDGKEELDLHPPEVQSKHRIVLYHDELTFYANDCCAKGQRCSAYGY
jgi:hypothetical protein